MNNIVKSCKFIHGLLGNSKKNISKEENYLSKIMRRSPYVIKTINKNSILNEENLALQRPEEGIKARQFIKILGKKANRELKLGSILKKNQYF
jgi:sialic acid synthase SpsE